jgi:hypothetical protein
MKESICQLCEYSRRVSSRELENKGYVGCCLPIKKEKAGFNVDREYSFIESGEEVAEGWVDLRSKPFGDGSGVSTNFQLITLGIKRCSEFKE